MRSNQLMRMIGIAAFAAILSCGEAAAETTLAVTGRANSNASIAASGRFVAVAWSASLPSGVTDIYAAVSRDDGRTFGAPVRVNDVDGDARVSGEQPPRVVLAPRASGDPAVTIVWTSKGDRGTRLLFARSGDGGRTFDRAADVPGSEAAGNRGWEAAAAAPDGRILTVWLDHRGLADQSAMEAMHHQTGKPDGVAMAQRSKLFVSSLDGAVPAQAVTGGVCYCCKTALAVADGRVYAAWRHVYPGNIRDIAFAESRDQGRSFAAPVRVSQDHWELEGCPDDGPAIAVAGGQVHVVWPTLVQNGPGGEPGIALFHAATRDGRTFTARQPLPIQGMAHHPQIVAIHDGALMLAWDEQVDGGRRIALARGLPDSGGAITFTRLGVPGGSAGLYPAVAAGGRAAILAWSTGGENGVIKVTRIQ
jgi:hypothetical protein